MKLSIKKLSESHGHRSPVYALTQYRPNQILTGGGEGWIASWDVDRPENGKLIATIKTSVFSLLYLPEANIIIAGDRDGGLHWITENGSSNDVFAHDKGVFGLYLLKDQLISLGGDGFLTRWNIHTQKPIESYQYSPVSLRSFTVDYESNLAYIGSSNGVIYSIDIDSFEVRSTSQVHKGAVFSMSVLPYNNLTSGGKDALLKVYESNPDNEMMAINAHWFAIYAIRVHPSGFFFATASRDKSIRLWSLPDINPLLTLDYKSYSGHTKSVNNILWTPDGHKLISVGDDACLIFWEVEIND